ncbi:MAG: glycosyltransferase family 39 protein [Candidatus Omnitrophota bacterium]
MFNRKRDGGREDVPGYYFLIVLVAAVIIRLININMPILEGTAMRQVQTAMVARNFFRHGIDILYPVADHFGAGPGYLVLEFPLLGVLSALGYMALGGVHEWVGRLISIFFFAGGAFFLTGITERIFGKKTALWTLAIFCFSPLSMVYSRAFMPDFEMLFFSLGALYFFVRYYREENLYVYWFSALFMSAALLVKPHSFYMFVPLLYLLCRKQGGGAFFRTSNWIYLAIAVVPAVLWYLHAGHVVGRMTPEQAYNYEMSNWFSPAELFNKQLYINLMEIYGGIMLTPFGLGLFAAGLFVRTKGDGNLIFAWLAGGILYLVAFITHIDDPYYNLNMLPVVSIFAARAITYISGLDWKGTFFSNKWGKAAMVLVVLPFWLRYAAYAYVVPEGYRYLPEAGREVQKIAGKEDLVIASAAGGAQGLYFCDRKGWSFALPGNSKDRTDRAIEKLEGYRKEGAKYFVCPVLSDFNSSVYFKDYMALNYRVADLNVGRYIIFSLEK